jgi:long-chain fatty acid transport protein
MSMNKNSARALLAAFVCFLAQSADATDVFRLEGFGPISRAMGGTAAAYDVGPAGMMTNPATLSLQTAEPRLHVGLDVVTTDIAARNQATGETASSDTHSNNRGPYFAPQLAFSSRSGALSFGVGAFAQGGLGTEYGRSSFLSRANGNLDTGLENSSRLLVLNIPFAASYQVNDALAIGGSLDAMWQGLNLELLLGADQVVSLIGAGRVGGSLVPVLAGLPDLRGAHFSLTRNQPLASGVDAWGVAARIGATYKVDASTVVGAAYSAESSVADMKGRATLTAVDGVAGQVQLNGNIEVRDFQMPANLVFGVSHRLDKNWLVTADISRVFWKHAMKDINVGFVADAGGTLEVRLPQDYKDQTIFAVGAAYDVGAWTLRAGFRVASQALRSETLFAVVPAIPIQHLSAGFSYRLSPGGVIHFAYAHAFEKTMQNTSLPNTSAPLNVSHSQNNFVIAYEARF